MEMGRTTSEKQLNRSQNRPVSETSSKNPLSSRTNRIVQCFLKRIVAAVATDSNGEAISLRSAWDKWQFDGRAYWQQMDALVDTLDGL